MKNNLDSKIIADTGIWIEFLKKNDDIFAMIQELLEKNYILAVGCIFGELLQGVKTRREMDIIMEYWKCLPKIDENNIWVEAGVYSNENKLIEKGVGLIDSLLVVLAVRNRLKLWTLDKKLRNILTPDIIYPQ
jgi:predicted nucleic acid-binding protein